MKTILHRADTRGVADHGWLHSKHTFSFANYHNPERMSFGALRVLNDDRVSPAMGFGTHPHRDMEIISLPLEGDLRHKDNMGNETVIRSGDVQVMSAGTGVLHSEYNNKPDQEVRFLQIWVLPNQKSVTPRYGQITLKREDRYNKWQQLLSPHPDDAGLWIHQDAWFNMADMERGKELHYSLNAPERNGVYVFVLEGDVMVNGQVLHKRDGFGVWDAAQLTVRADSDAALLLMEVPMTVK